MITTEMLERLLTVIKESGLRPKAISKQSRVPFATIKALFAGERVELSEAALLKLSEVFKVEYLWLSRGLGPKDEIPLAEKISQLDRDTDLLRKLNRTPILKSILEGF
ncbi:hypothetical protein [Leptospira adleri]|uniref:HTH cro/C1-type domain-containing protein n=1 Tax=Leptospira adleri TaxID=2023186 RepID=A0A2M9YJD6_9LEPT|nr:hypothetical protein [Leptospira adleri]PJZ51620.1 hypothetical protein CH380_19435 [Leptospira adleri]PJZ61871.1 hypothetical protein CH376_10730 [Leptospira adleri]